MSRKPRVLCVDDRVANLAIRAKFLEQCGCIVIAVHDHHAALKAVTENEVDIALVDFHLGDGVTGEEVINDIRVVCPHIRIILFSGDLNIPESAKRRADAVLLKGLSDPRELAALIHLLVPDTAA